MKRFLKESWAALSCAAIVLIVLVISLMDILPLLFVSTEKLPDPIRDHLIGTSVVQVAVTLMLLCPAIVSNRERQRKLILANEQLSRSDERFRLAMAHMPYIIFEYDFDDETITLLNGRGDAGNPEAGSMKMRRADVEEVIFDEDLDRVLRTLNEVGKGETTGSVVHFRMKARGETEHRWFSFTLSGVTDQHGKTVRGIGIIEDIDDQRTENIRLREKADTDPLTGIFNRTAVERLADSLIMEGDPESKYAFMVIDLDHFKTINDNLGHLYGDEILKEVALALSSTFRSSDIVGRLGGDEFCVFLEGVNNLEIIRRKLRRPLAALADPGLHNGYSVTLSVGVVFGGSEVNFAELYRKGDLALYDAKKQGRNRIAVYEG